MWNISSLDHSEDGEININRIKNYQVESYDKDPFEELTDDDDSNDDDDVSITRIIKPMKKIVNLLQQVIKMYALQRLILFLAIPFNSLVDVESFQVQDRLLFLCLLM